MTTMQRRSTSAPLSRESCLKHFMQTINATDYTKSFMLEASHPYEYDETEDSAELRFSPISGAEMYFEQAQNGM